MKRVLKLEKIFWIEEKVKRKNGETIWINNNVTVMKDLKNQPSFTISLCLDITEKMENEKHREMVHARLHFLTDVSMTLSSSLDYLTTIKKVTNQAIPLLGDWCYVHLLSNNDESFKLADLSCSIPSLIEPLHEFASMFASDKSPNAVSTCLRTREIIMRNDLNDEYYQKAATSEKQLNLFRTIRPKGVIVAPLISRGNLLGAITISYCTERSPYKFEDVDLMKEVSQRAALAIDNAKLYSQSGDAIKARDDFLSIASHELKTPVTSLKLQTQMTLRKLDSLEVGKEGRDYLFRTLSTSINHIDRMTKLIEEMLDISRLQHGTFRLSKHKMELGHLLNDILNRIEDDLKHSNNTLEIQVEGSLEGNWDSLRIEQVISNVLSNAMKYSPGVPIHIKAMDRGEKVLIAIHDEGKGIAAENLEKIFMCFERVASRAEISGLGLGLYISRQIIEAHGGKIWAESDIGKGATFFIELHK